MNISTVTINRLIDTSYDAETSLVLRYRNAFTFGSTEEEDARFKEWLQRTSIREGARVFFLLSYKGVRIYILDETSLMHTRTLKSIDGCVTTAKCKAAGYDKVVFESGGNTGAALTAYGVRAGLETFCFVPDENLTLLPKAVFAAKKAHLISVEEPALVKKAAHLFSELNGVKHIPETTWRYEASRFRGLFILEYVTGHFGFDWLTQTISAAFGPIGIYWSLKKFGHPKIKIPRFLGIQQEVNCPMYRGWKSKRRIVRPLKIESTAKLLTKVMYDFKPHTYGTFSDLVEILKATRGDLTTVSHSEFNEFIERHDGGMSVLNLLREKGVAIPGEVVDRTGLIALVGTLKEIDKGKIARGSRVLCCLTSGTGGSDGLAKPEHRIRSVRSMINDYMKELSS